MSVFIGIPVEIKMSATKSYAEAKIYELPLTLTS